MRGRAGLLFDLRGALQIQAANAALVIVAGLSSVSWSGIPRGDRTAWSVVDWRPESARESWQAVVGFVPDAELTVLGTGAAFYVGNIPGGDAPPPDYLTASDDELRAGSPLWSSTVDLVAAMFTEQDLAGNG
ncbi:hypothetical protein ACFCV3_10545 [Kribbella sp. NPDC056345]|uniref:hypothetical protein n=1 Tax=Kribbella sp. NPDC056345 TaxID=3345789 RepID=UPI0035E2FE3E